MYCRILFFLVITSVNHCCGMDIMPPKESQIILLNGTTTAGKSTIAAELKKKLEARNFAVEVLAIDTFMVPKVQWALGLNRLNPFNCFIPNIDIITSSEIEIMGQESQLELCTVAKTAYEEGKIVIIDAPIYRPDQIAFYKKELAGLKLTWVLVYRSISSLVDGIIGRNQKSGISERRSLLQGLYQFSCMYSGNAKQCIGQLSQETLHSICNTAQKEHAITEEQTFDLLKSVQKAICPFSFADIRQLLFKNLSLNDNATAQIGPMMEHDCVVSTGLFDSTVCAQMIIDYFSEI